MTQGELDALPDATTGFGCREEIRDGKKVLIPVMAPTVGVLWTEPDEVCAVVDADGQRWRVGWYNGVRYKRRT